MNDRFVVRTQPYRIENQMVFHNFQKAKDFYYQIDKKGKGVQLLYQFITPQGQYEEHLWKDNRNPLEGSFTFDAENFGGDPEGKLAKALERARKKAKQPRKPLKIERLKAESPQVGDEGLFWSRYNNRRVRIVGIEDNSGKTNAIGNPLGDVYFYRDLLDSGEADWRIHTDSEREFLSRFKPDKRAESFGAEHKANLELIPYVYVEGIGIMSGDNAREHAPRPIVWDGYTVVDDSDGHELLDIPADGSPPLQDGEIELIEAMIYGFDHPQINDGMGEFNVRGMFWTIQVMELLANYDPADYQSESFGAENKGMTDVWWAYKIDDEDWKDYTRYKRRNKDSDLNEIEMFMEWRHEKSWENDEDIRYHLRFFDNPKSAQKFIGRTKVIYSDSGDEDDDELIRVYGKLDSEGIDYALSLGDSIDWELYPLLFSGNILSDYKQRAAESFGAENRPPSYMADSDAHKLMEASWRINSFVESTEEYPQWWKSRLSVAASNVDDLADYLDYAMSDDYDAETFGADNMTVRSQIVVKDKNDNSINLDESDKEKLEDELEDMKIADQKTTIGNLHVSRITGVDIHDAETFNASTHNPYSVDLYEDEDTPPYYPYLAPEYTTVYGRGRYRFNLYGTDGMTWKQHRFPTKDKAIEWLCYQTLSYWWVKPNQPQYDFPPNTPDSEIKMWHRAETYGAENRSLAKRSWDALNNVETAVGTVGLAHMIGLGAIFGGSLAFLKGRKSNSKTEK